jgi:hypothetical protein
MTISVFTITDVNKEIKRRHLDPTRVRGLACSGCAIFSAYPFVGPWGHFVDCLVSDQPRSLSFQFADGTYSHPSKRVLDRQRKQPPPRERQGPIVIAHGDY